MVSIWKILKTVLSLPFILITAWILTHVMAIFGTFAVSAYPIWTTFFPSTAVCLGCRSGIVGENCALCNEKIEKGIYRPKHARSILLNTLIIALLTVFSIGVVYFESKIIEKSGVTTAFKTVSFNIPDKSQYRTNEIFPMKIEITGIKSAVNVIQADITFDPDILEVIDISTKESFATIFVQKDVNNSLGYVRLTGGVPNPGYTKENGTFGTVFFKTKSAGLVTVSFLPTSLVLANDGRGTNVLKEFPSSSYVVRPESISQEQELTQSEFYKNAVLGTTSKIDKDDCKISFITGDIPDVLGASTDPNDILVEKIDGTQTADLTSKEVTTSENVFTQIINFLSWIDQWIISIYSKLFTTAFTN